MVLNQLGVKPAVGRKRHANQHAQVYRCHCAVGARRPPACDRHETGLSLSAPDAESWFSRSHRIARSETHQHTLHLQYTVYSLYVHCRGSRGRAFSLSRTANTSFSSAPRVRVQ